MNQDRHPRSPKVSALLAFDGWMRVTPHSFVLTHSARGDDVLGADASALSLCHHSYIIGRVATSRPHYIVQLHRAHAVIPAAIRDAGFLHA
jgi:hypothetical protein